MSIKKFNKASLAMAVAGALAASSAQAVNIAEDGLGDFIFGQYYTVRDGWNTYINVTNTSEETVVFKIRFRELYNSRDVRDFNVILSPYDVWTAALVDNGDVARLVTNDRSCTSPLTVRDNGIDFTNAAYSGAAWDGGPEDLERTTEGYFEIINMGQDADQTLGDNHSQLAADALHVNGEPVNCVGASNAFAAGNIAQVQADFDEPENFLKVNVALINVDDGMGISYEPITFANFFNPAIGNPSDQLSTADLIFPPSSANPHYGHVNPNTSEVRMPMVGANMLSNWTIPGDAVSAVLMRNAAINQYRSDTSDPAADTDWVVTFPTKWGYVDLANLLSPVVNPFVEYFDGESCVTAFYNHWDREERSPEALIEVQPSPYVPGESTELCHEVNVIEFGAGVVAGQDTYMAETPYTEGWTRLDVGLDFDGTGALINEMVDNNGVLYQGLPMIGIAVSNLDNPIVENAQYGFAWNHSYTRSIIGDLDVVYTTNGAPAGQATSSF